MALPFLDHTVSVLHSSESDAQNGLWVPKIIAILSDVVFQNKSRNVARSRKNAGFVGHLAPR